MKKKRMALLMCSLLLTAGMSVLSYAESKEETADSEKVIAEESNSLTAPVDFTLDPVTGEYSFTTTDERMGYYFIRFYQAENVNDGVYKTSSKRIGGGTAGTVSGTVDLSELGWGTYCVKLVSFAPAGTDYESPDPVTLTVEYGVDLKLERPEMLAIYSGNEADLVIDWWTLSDYYTYEYMPNIKFTFYSDAECANEVFSDTVDCSELERTIFGGRALESWGYSTSEGKFLYQLDYDPEEAGKSHVPWVTELYFEGDCYKYTLEDMGLSAGTYYVTCQALSSDDFVLDSEISTVLELTLTEDEATAEFSEAATELWTEPEAWISPGVKAGQRPERVDCCLDQPVIARVAE